MNGFALTWLAFGLVLAVFGARAWVVETSRGRFSNGGGAQRGLTVAAGASVVLLVVMLTFNGGLELVDLLVNGEPATTADTAPADTGPADTGPADTAPAAPGQGGPQVPGPAPAAPAAPANP